MTLQDKIKKLIEKRKINWIPLIQDEYLEQEVFDMKDKFIADLEVLAETPSENSEVDVEKIKNICLDYLWIDWWHHKQYALEEIMKVINPKWINEDYEKWIPW